MKKFSLVLIGLGILLLVLQAQSQLVSPSGSGGVNISGSGTACVPKPDCRPAITAWGNDVYLVWAQEEAGNSEIFFRKGAVGADGIVTFTPPLDQPAKVIAETPGISQQPTITVLGGVLLVAWADNSSGNFEVLLARSVNGGDTWEWDEENRYFNLSENSGESKQPAIGVGGTGIFIAWADNTRDPSLNPDGTRNVFLRASLDGGQTFTNPVNISNSSGRIPAERPALTVDGTAETPTVFIVWQQGAAGREIFFRQSTAFSSPLNISKSPSMDSSQPAIAFQSFPEKEGRKIFAIWTETTAAGMTQIFSNSNREPDAGIHFSTPQFGDPYNRFPARTPQRAPGVAMDAQGTTFLVWEEDYERPGATPEIRFWHTLDPLSPPTNLSQTPTTASRNPVIAVDATSAYVAWVEEVSPSKFDIFFTRVPIVH